MGSIRVRRDTGKLLIDFYYQGVRCREQTLLDDTPINRKRLRDLLEKIEKEIAFGVFDYGRTFPSSPRARQFADHSIQPLPPGGATISDVPTFSEFAEEWYSENAFRWKPSGRIGVRNILSRHLIPAFGDMAVNAISKGDVMKFRASLAQLPGRKDTTLSPKRINNILQPMKNIMDEASERFGFSSPFRNIKPLKGNKPDVQPFTLSEVRLILDHVRPDYRNYFTVRFFTGMRSGEIHGLRWHNVDFERNVIHVNESFTYGKLQETKTLDSVRDIQMLSLVREALIQQREVTMKLGEFVFANRDGKPLDTSNVAKRVWYPLLRYLGLKERRPYQTRHTAASLWLAAGESPEWIARQLGHSSTQMLFQTYSRYIPNATRQDGAAFEALVHQESLPQRREPCPDSRFQRDLSREG